jgi:hypothetical protein
MVMAGLVNVLEPRKSRSLSAAMLRDLLQELHTAGELLHAIDAVFESVCDWRQEIPADVRIR